MTYARRTDASQAAIVAALRKAGCMVWIIGQPVDLLVRRPQDPYGVFHCLEVKTPTKTGKRPARRDQKAQERFCAETGTKYALTPEAALQAMGLTP